MSRSGASDSLGLIAWTCNPGRLNDIGKAFLVEPKTIGFPRWRSRWSAPSRYLVSIVLTLAWLWRARPKVVIVSCPPPFAALLVAVYARVAHAAFVLDAHPGAFGYRDRLWRLFVPLQKALVSCAHATMVTNTALAETVRQWGGSPLVFHEAPPPTHARPPKAVVADRPKVVFTTIFDPDEPLGTITAAASDLGECEVAITGNQSRLASELRRQLESEPHIQLTGWLDQGEYLALIAGADVVVALTHDPHSVMRSAFEAIYLERPTVLSDTATLRGYFSPSVFVENTPDAVAAGVRGVLADYASWIERAASRQLELTQRWATQRVALEAVIGTAMVRAPAGTGVLLDG
jgi:glycosyltransferase involved in cell wall biosynthesis